MTITANRKVFPLSTAYGVFGHLVGLGVSPTATMRDALGDKATRLAEMIAGGIDVPPAVTVLASVCQEFYDNDQRLPPGLLEEVLSVLGDVEQRVGRRFGDDFNPLLVSVRAGAAVDMPGMMDTILNLGLTDYTTEVLAAQLGEHFAVDSYRRFIESYGTVVLGIPSAQFDRIRIDAVHRAGVPDVLKLSIRDLRELVEIYKTFVWDQAGNPFPQNPHEQLRCAIEAVFKSWNSERARVFRSLNEIDDTMGTAVTIQAMVFGNLNEQSGSGLCFTRDPGTGDSSHMCGEYLLNAQGGDVAASVRKPQQLFRLGAEMPRAFAQLITVCKHLEVQYRDLQEVHFTIENGRLYVLHCRSGARTAQAAVRIAVDLANEGLISQRDAVERIEPAQWRQLLRPVFSGEKLAAAKMMGRHVATGLAAAPGAATGKIVFDPVEAAERTARGEDVILVGAETCPADIIGIAPAAGIVTARGGITCYGAHTARMQSKPCIAGCETLKVDLHNQLVIVGRHAFFKNDVISIDGSNGEIYAGSLHPDKVKRTTELDTLLAWTQELDMGNAIVDDLLA